MMKEIELSQQPQGCLIKMIVKVNASKDKCVAICTEVCFESLLLNKYSNLLISLLHQFFVCSYMNESQE